MIGYIEAADKVIGTVLYNNNGRAVSLYGPSEWRSCWARASKSKEEEESYFLITLGFLISARLPHRRICSGWMIFHPLFIFLLLNGIQEARFSLI